MVKRRMLAILILVTAFLIMNLREYGSCSLILTAYTSSISVKIQLLYYLSILGYALCSCILRALRLISSTSDFGVRMAVVARNEGFHSEVTKLWHSDLRFCLHILLTCPAVSLCHCWFKILHSYSAHFSCSLIMSLGWDFASSFFLLICIYYPLNLQTKKMSTLWY